MKTDILPHLATQSGDGCMRRNFSDHRTASDVALVRLIFAGLTMFWAVTGVLAWHYL